MTLHKIGGVTGLNYAAIYLFGFAFLFTMLAPLGYPEVLEGPSIAQGSDTVFRCRGISPFNPASAPQDDDSTASNNVLGVLGELQDLSSSDEHQKAPTEICRLDLDPTEID